MQKKILLYFFIGVLFSGLFASCATLLPNTYAREIHVDIPDDYETAKKKMNDILNKKSYIKYFETTDKAGMDHWCCILDDNYMLLDDVLFAYKFHNLMYYSPKFKLFGETVLEPHGRVIGIQGYARPLKNPDLTVNFIFAERMPLLKKYGSQYEACQIEGIYFASPSTLERSTATGYVDANGNYRKYEIQNYINPIFGSRQHCRTRKWQALSAMRKPVYLPWDKKED